MGEVLGGRGGYRSGLGMIKWRIPKVNIMNTHIRRLTVLIVNIILLPKSGAVLAAENLCQPKSNATRILNAPSPNSIHPNWQGENYVGLSWNLVRYGEVTKDGIRYVKGKLLPPFRPNGGYSVNDYYNSSGDIIWGMLSEWDCP